MDWIVKGLIGLAIMAAVIAALTAINRAIGEHYIAPVRVEYEAKLASCKQEVADAVRANATVRTTLEQTIKTYSEAEADAAAKRKEAADRASAAIAEQREKSKAAKAKIDRDKAIANGPPTTGDRLEQCDKADATLTDLATELKQ